MKKKRISMKTSILIRWITFILAPAMLLSACVTEYKSPITPAADRPTFLYFYTDN